MKRNHKKLKCLAMMLAACAMWPAACTDDEGEDVGSQVQPENDRLQAFSNMVEVSTNTVMVDSALGKAELLYLGQYTDSHFGVTQAEFLTQLDARIGGVNLPDTTVSTSSATQGISNTLLTAIDSSYGNILSIKNARAFTVDSAFFLVRYSDDFLGDSTALQGVKVYELSQDLKDNQRYFTNIDVTAYCDKKNLLGSLPYVVAGKRDLMIPFDVKYAQKIASVYTKKGEYSGIKSQADFNKNFKGFYISHSFNEGAIVQVTVCGLLIYYHYQADLETTLRSDGSAVTVKTESLKTNPLATSVFLSANHAVERAYSVSHPGADRYMEPLLKDKSSSYSFVPGGMYTAVDVPFETVVDSISSKVKDTSKVMMNSALLYIYAQNLNWATKLKKSPNQYMLLVQKDKVADFFYSNSRPNGRNSFVGVYDSTLHAYSFDLSYAVQKRIKGDTSLLKTMVAVPIYLTTSDNISYYHQQLWPTGVWFYGTECSDRKMRPRLDLVYTLRH